MINFLEAPKNMYVKPNVVRYIYDLGKCSNLEVFVYVNLDELNIRLSKDVLINTILLNREVDKSGIDAKDLDHNIKKYAVLLSVKEEDNIVFDKTYKIFSPAAVSYAKTHALNPPKNDEVNYIQFKRISNVVEFLIKSCIGGDNRADNSSYILHGMMKKDSRKECLVMSHESSQFID